MLILKEEKLFSKRFSFEEAGTLLAALPKVLRDLLGECMVTAHYGIGCDIHADLQYVAMRVRTSWIERFIDESLEKQIVLPGRSDFYISAPDARLQILFCHESDIHLAGEDDELVHRFTLMEPYSQYGFQSASAWEAQT